jgi:hypothetical protein
LAREPAADALQVGRPAEHPQRHGEGRVKLMQVPTQPLLRAAPLVDEIIAVVDEQLQIAEDLLAWTRPAKLRLTERCSRDRERIDRVRLPARPASATLGRHQLRRHPHQLLTRPKQLPLEPARQLPAILHRPQPLASEPCRPADELVAADRDRPLVEQPTSLVNRYRRH